MKAWTDDKDVEALRCQKALVEEEEAAQKKHVPLTLEIIFVTKAPFIFHSINIFFYFFFPGERSFRKGNDKRK